MSEVMENISMYDEVAEIQSLNRVEGFDPKKYMRIIQEEGGTAKYYLDVAYRKLWFRLKYPEGKIVKKILKLTEQIAIVEARVYLNRNDAEDNFISNALAQKYYTTDEQFGNKYVELAETAAVGRALTDAGFGLQFADCEREPDPQVTEAPFESGRLFHKNPPDGTCTDAGELSTVDGTLEGALSEDDNILGQYKMDEYALMGDEDISGSTTASVPTDKTSEEQHGNRHEAENKVSQSKNGEKPAQPSERRSTGMQNGKNPKPGNSLSDIRKDMPAEQIYQLLDSDKAAAVVISVGCHKNKTLGQLAVEKPKALEWYVNSYGGPDNLLRAAAKYLLDQALKPAG